MTDSGRDPRDDRVVSYLRSRSTVEVPHDLLSRAMPTLAAQSPAPLWARPPRLLGGVAATLALVVIAVVVAVNLPGPTGVVPSGSATPSASVSPTTTLTPLPSVEGTASRPSESPSPSPTPSTTAPTATPTPSPRLTEMPTAYRGMPVLTVKQAKRLLDGGELDGRAVAIAGYLGIYPPASCYPNSPSSPVQPYGCRMQVLTDARADAVLCHDKPNGVTSCHFPSSGAPYLVPVLVPETSGRGVESAPLWQPVRVVMIGHAGDPRRLQCPPDEKDACAQAFVVDRVVWAAGRDVPLTSVTSSDPADPAPRMGVDQVVADLGVSDDALSAIAVRASEVSTIEPRWNLVGDDLVWVVRSLDVDVGNSSAITLTRGEKSWLVDDATGQLLESLQLDVPADYVGARLWQRAMVDFECCNSSLPDPFYEVSANGAQIHAASRLSCAVSYTATCGWGEPPLVLEPGTYTVREWMAVVGDDGTVGPPTNECSTQVTLSASDDLMLPAEFALGSPCTFAPLTSYAPLEYPQ